MPSNPPGAPLGIIDLCAIYSEPLFTSSFECPLIAAYCSGRLFNCLNWLLFRGALRGELETRRITAARDRLQKLLESTIGEPDRNGLKLAALNDYDRFKKWFKSEGRDVWCESLRSMSDSNNRFASTRPLQETSGLFRRNLAYIEAVQSQEAPIDPWQPGAWDELKGVKNFIEPRWDAANREAAELGYEVDDGLRPLNAPREMAVMLAIQGSAADGDWPINPLWFPRLSKILKRVGICGELIQKVESTWGSQSQLERIALIDCAIREALADRWRSRNKPPFFNLVLSPTDRTIHRKGSQYPPPIPLGNDYWFVEAAVTNRGFLTHGATESIFRDPNKGKGKVTGDYKGAFGVRLSNSINPTLEMLDIVLKGVPNQGYRLFDLSELTLATWQSAVESMVEELFELAAALPANNLEREPLQSERNQLREMLHQVRAVSPSVRQQVSSMLTHVAAQDRPSISNELFEKIGELFRFYQSNNRRLEWRE